MEITFNLPYVFNPDSSQVDNAYALRSLLDCLIALNLGHLRFHTVPGLYQSGVKYGRTKVWEPIPALYLKNKIRDQFDPVYFVPNDYTTIGAKRRGDCKSLTAALIAEYMIADKKCQPVFRFAPRKDGSGLLDFHILVQTEHGFEDPSKELGMGKDEVARFYQSAGSQRKMIW